VIPTAADDASGFEFIRAETERQSAQWSDADLNYLRALPSVGAAVAATLDAGDAAKFRTGA
jgi:hypothetical protein